MASQPARSPRWHLPTSTLGRAALAVVALVALMLGVLAGRYVAYQTSISGLASIGAVLMGALFGLAIILVIAVGLVAARIRRGFSTPIVALLLAAGLTGVGAVGGGLTAPITGGLYVAPVVQEATGATQAEVTAGGMPFVARAGASAACRSVPDGRAVDYVMALDVGELGTGRLNAWITLPGDGGPDLVGIALIIDGADLAQGAMQPEWVGAARLEGADAERVSGTIVFDRIRLVSNVNEPGGADWPATLSGRISWTCGPWGPQE